MSWSVQKLLTNALLAMAALVVFGTDTAHARSIVNTASARWTSGRDHLTVKSNTVTFDVIDPVALLTVLPPASTPEGYTLSSGWCDGAALPVSRIDAASMIVKDGAIASTVKIGQPVIVRLVLSRAGLDPATPDKVRIKLTSASGDMEKITVEETGADTGIFVGAVPTSAIPPRPVGGDCRLSVAGGDTVTAEFHSPYNGNVVVKTSVDVLADPFGLVFDSEDGTPVDGSRITLVDAATGQPATVYADDGVTPWPSTIVSGENVVDGAGNAWPMPPGEYRFPLAPLGTYRLKVEPPAPYTAPSRLTPAQMTGLTRPDGGELVLLPASFGGDVRLASPAPIRVDIPVDRLAVAVALSKVASRQVAQPGDAVFYTITVHNTDAQRAKRAVVLTDHPDPALRLRQRTVLIDGKRVRDAATVTADGRALTVVLGTIEAGATRTVTYAMTVRPEAAAGEAVNRVETVDSRGLSSVASAVVRIERDNLAATMTLIGRVTAGPCSVAGPRPGIPGVRLVLEDGSFAVTDADGRYHFEGLMPGTHVVEAQDVTLPKGGQFADCTHSSRSAGSATSRFVTGQGGSLATADFAAVLPDAPPVAAATDAPAPSATVDDGRAAAGADTDWLALGDGPDGFVFPAPDHNPRAPAVRVVVRHRAGQRVDLKINGKPVDKLAFDGVKTAPQGYAVSIWRGIPLDGEDTRFEADVSNADGAKAATFSRIVHFAATPARVEIVPEQSHLVADGASRPVVAVRVLDRSGRSVHAGLSGQFALSAPYESAQALDAMQSRVLAGLDKAPPAWTVKGDDGIALIELAPTMVSGGLDLTFAFNDHDVKRQQVVQAWIVPGDQKWTLVGLAEGAVGAKTVADAMERSGHFDSDLGDHARVALYAKGRILGRFLTTLAYDSAKQRAEQRLLGGLDPQAYYTVFADGSDRRFDAASVNKLYLRVESSRVRALYGDFSTGFNHTKLAHYERTMSGVLAEARAGRLNARGYAAKVASTHIRDEIPGAGISGPYRLSSRAMIPNSETVTIEVRDRFRSDIIVSQQTLQRFLDYDVDLLSGTVLFKQPVLSRDDNLNPQIIVVEYDVDSQSGGQWNAGARAEWLARNEAVRLGASWISDKGDATRTDIGAVDARVRLGQATELRAEAALSRKQGINTAGWLFEAEHHDQRLDVLAYARSLDQAFGVGQVDGADLGRRKLGIDSRYAINQALSVGASAWLDDSLSDPSRRDAVQLRTTYTTKATELRLGLARYGEHLADGTSSATTLVEAGTTRRMFDNKLELSTSASFALGNETASSYQPPRYRFGARYAVTTNVRVLADYEIAKGAQGNSRTVRAGLELAPLTGSRLAASLGEQSITELGSRTFAAYGLAQSLPLGKHLTLDATIDGNRVLGGGGALATTVTASGSGTSSTTVAEDFTAYTFGAAWRAGRWSATARAELRNGELSRRKGFTAGAIRQLGEGSVVGAGATWAHSLDATGLRSDVASAAISLAHRPATSAFAFLAKLEYRSDAIAGATAAALNDTALSADGNARSRRVVASFSGDLVPHGRREGDLVQRNEVGVFAAARQNLDRYNGYDLAGTTVLGGLDVRIGVGDRVEVGAAATVRHSVSDGTTSFAIGPQVGIVPASNVLVVVGYNIAGFRDRDFAATRSTTKGVFATIRMKFDSNTLAALGIGRQ